MSTSSTSNTEVTKNTIAIGLSQIMQMALVFVRAKIIAVLLGPSGIGIYSILVSIVMVVQQIGSFGIYQSGVRELSILHASDKAAYAGARTSFLSMSLFCGVCCAAIMALLSPAFNIMFFKDDSHLWYIAATAIGVLFFSLASGRNTLLQAGGRLTALAKASVSSSLAGVSIAGIIIYLFRYDGIPAAIVAGYAVMWLFSRQKERRNEAAERLYFSWNIKEYYRANKKIIDLGAYLMAGTLAILLFTLLLNAVISSTGLDEVGYYQAAASIMSQGLVVCSMVLAADFFPRISKASENNAEIKTLTNQELSMLGILILPISSVLIVFSQLVVEILYTPEFVIVSQMIRIMAISLIFRVVWITFSYVILSKGDKKRYLVMDALVGNGLNFALCIVGFRIGGLNGIALAWLGSAAAVAAILALTCRKYYGTGISTRNLIQLGISFGITLALTILISLDSQICKYAAWLVLFAVISLSAYRIHSTTELFAILAKRFKK